MDFVAVIALAGLIVGLATFAAIFYWLRVTHRTIEHHRDILERLVAAQVASVDTAREANEIAQKANEQYRQALDRQLRFSMQPHLFCEPVVQNNVLSIEVSNVGLTPAYDVHLLMVAVYDSAETPLEPFLQTYVKPETGYKWAEARALNGNMHDRFPFGVVYERSYAVFPAGRKLAYPLYLPVLPKAIYTILFSRNAAGETYGQLSRFLSGAPPEERMRNPYTLAYRRPQTLSFVPSVSFVEFGGRYVLLPLGNYIIHMLAGDTRLVRLDGDNEVNVDPNDTSGLPEYLKDELLLSALRHSMPARFLLREFAVSADRETWLDVSDHHLV